MLHSLLDKNLRDKLLILSFFIVFPFEMVNHSLVYLLLELLVLNAILSSGRMVKQALSDKAGDAKAGRDLLVSRISNCTLCHAVIETGERFFGNVGPSLSGVGSRLDAAQLRLHLVNPAYFNPQTIMPSYYRVEGLNKVALEFQGKPVLGAQAIEDVIAYLLTLK